MSTTTDVTSLLGKPSTDAAEAGKIGGRLDNAENKFLNVLSNPKASQAEIMKAEQEFKRVSRVYEAFTKMKDTIDDLMRQVIRNLGIN